MSSSRSAQAQVQRTVFTILIAISFSHLLNDTIQSLIPAIYPLVKSGFHLSFAQVGLITFTFQITASILQPVIGAWTDKRPVPFMLVVGMGSTLGGLLLLSRAWSFSSILVAVAFVGLGSAVFHPEASRIASLASGGKRGTAQSIFQVGGNLGSSIGPLLAALIIVPYGQHSIAWFAAIALLAIVVLWRVSAWYRHHPERLKPKARKERAHPHLSRRRIIITVVMLLILIFSKHVYTASIGSYFTFFLIDRFHLSVQAAQFHLFIFLFAMAAGTVLGGPLGDRYGRKPVIWFSIVGAAPFTLMLPYADLFWTTVLSIIIGLVIASAFSAILVYAQELLPGRIGLVSGLFFGFAFGIAGIGSAVLGELADRTSIGLVYHVCSYLPLLGLLAIFLPPMDQRKGVAPHAEPTGKP